MLKVRDLTFRYSQNENFLWKPLNFDLNEGEILLLKGRNGSGKTTLLQCLCGIIPSMIEGEIRGEINFRERALSDLELKEIAPEINILFQEPDKQIFMPVVEEEIVFGPENLLIERGEILKRLDNVLQRLKIEHLRNKATGSLSFGEKKLVVLASILTMSPGLFLIDEFSAGMEDNTINNFASYIEELKSEGKSFILTEHHQAFDHLTDRTIDLNELISH